MTALAAGTGPSPNPPTPSRARARAVSSASRTSPTRPATSSSDAVPRLAPHQICQSSSPSRATELFEHRDHVALTAVDRLPQPPPGSHVQRLTDLVQHDPVAWPRGAAAPRSPGSRPPRRPARTPTEGSSRRATRHPTPASPPHRAARRRHRRIASTRAACQSRTAARIVRRIRPITWRVGHYDDRRVAVLTADLGSYGEQRVVLALAERQHPVDRAQRLGRLRSHVLGPHPHPDDAEPGHSRSSRSPSRSR